jgi:hypothetical protein
LASFPLSCVRAVTVFAVDFWHDHNSLTSVILNTESLVHASRKRRAVAMEFKNSSPTARPDHMAPIDRKDSLKSKSWGMSESKKSSNFIKDMP